MAHSPLLLILLSLSALILSVSAVCNSPQVTCPTSASNQVPTPFYALTFDINPATSVGGTTDYQWLATDTSETCAYEHAGVVYLGAAANNGAGAGASDGTGVGYIDLNSTTGAHSAGSSLTSLANLGSASSGLVSQGSSGWSLEFTGKAFANTAGADFYCLGQGSGVYDILQGFVGTTNEVDHTIGYGVDGNTTFTRAALPSGPTSGLQYNECQHTSTLTQLSATRAAAGQPEARSPAHLPLWSHLP